MSQTSKTVLILGASSAVAEATARLYAAEGARLLLVGRKAEQLEVIAADLKVRGAAVADIALCDLGNVTPASVAENVAVWTERLGGVIDDILIAYGVLGEQSRAETDLADAAAVMQVNFTSAALWCLAVAGQLEQQRAGTLVVLGSVAGDRGRQSNYLYGATKAGLDKLVQGIAHRLSKVGARAVIVKPGPIDTPMTAGMKKGGPMWSTPQAVAAIVRRAADRGGVTVYAPKRWKFIMLIIRFLPDAIFHRSSL
ncbi:SDR family NAD(P)-dependent oxidoreductase [Acidisoma silvae]|uniref:SDR family NAD(P)-dependent oxidoreductase n=1 Tax=Acidisoma silvae TaxID=2802396 RepID=UPI001D0BCA4E|nr:SDR family NAD(P)-dependent oxidoreductase [Acidisoma silvae]